MRVHVHFLEIRDLLREERLAGELQRCLELLIGNDGHERVIMHLLNDEKYLGQDRILTQIAPGVGNGSVKGLEVRMVDAVGCVGPCGACGLNHAFGGSSPGSLKSAEVRLFWNLNRQVDIAAPDALVGHLDGFDIHRR